MGEESISRTSGLWKEITREEYEGECHVDYRTNRVKMPDERQRQLSDPFDMFGRFGNFEGFGGSIFGRNPFDDPFFTRPFSNMLRSNNTLREAPPVAPPSGPIIKELDSDDDYEEEEMDSNSEEGRNAGSATEPFVDHPDDEVDEKKEQADYRSDRTDYNQAGGTQPQSFKVHSCKVTYGGVDGVYYTSSATRRMGNDGMIMEDCEEADKRTGEATHRISRGLHNKGHSVSRKLKSDGKVNMSQTLHNLNEDELGSFEDAWKGKGGKQIPFTGSHDSGVDRMSDRGGFLLPSTRQTSNTAGSRSSNENVSNPPSSTTKKIVRIPID